MRMTRAALRAQAEQPLIHEDASASTQSSPESRTQTETETAVLREIVNVNVQYESHPTPAKVIHYNASPSKHIPQLKSSPRTPSLILASPYELLKMPVADAVGSGTELKADSDRIGTPSVSEFLTEGAPKSTTQEEKLELSSAASEHNAATTKTPKFDSVLHDSDSGRMVSPEGEDSFVHSIKSRTPGKLSAQKGPDGEDSFVEKITSRTPRRTSRIEDSVEAMDALEDAIEQFSGELPVLDNLRIDSPIKERHNISPAVSKHSSLTTSHPSATASRSRTASKSPGKSPARSTTAAIQPKVKPATLRPLVVRQPVLDPRRAVSDKTVPKANDKASMSFSNSPLKMQSTLKKRSTSGPLSTSRPGFVPSKSTKPPTKSNFVLPGEVYAAKLKAEREAKLDTTIEPKQFKARPVPKSRPSVVPRENKASQARMSMAPNATASTTQSATAAANKRVSSLDVAKVRNPSNTSLKRASSTVSGVSRTSSAVREPKFAANVPRVASLATKPAAAPTSSEPEISVVQKKVSGKQVFARTKLELKKQEDEKRQKEDAAKKARAEAAERGRQASREWAEKKAKMAAAKMQAAS